VLAAEEGVLEEGMVAVDTMVTDSVTWPTVVGLDSMAMVPAGYGFNGGYFNLNFGPYAPAFLVSQLCHPRMTTMKTVMMTYLRKMST
jgi:hypothetical protein